MSSPAPRNRQSQFFQVAEQTSVVASIVGVAVSAFSQQVLYAAAPLSLSLGLNLVNRRRFERQTEQRLDRAIAQIDQQLSQLDRRVLDLPVSNLSVLSEQVRLLTAQLPTAEQQQAEARSQLAEMRSDFETIQRRQDSTTVSLEARFSAIQDNFSQEIQTIRDQLETGTSQQDELRLLQQALSRLAEQLTRLNEATQSELESQITQLRSQFTDETANQARLETQLTQAQAEIQSIREQAETAISVQQGFANLARQLEQLQARFDEIESQQVRSRIVKPVPELIIPAVTVEPVTPQIPNLPDVEELADLALNLGIDFGTSFTKVCFRDVSRERSEIVTFTDELTHLEESLLPTRIGILKDGTLIAGLTDLEWRQYDDRIQTSIKFIKMRLVDLDLPQSNANWRLEQLPELDDPETVENLCAYYISRVIYHAQTWIRQHKPELILNQHIQWSANVGVPVEYCDSPASERFKSVLSLAWLLSNEPQTEPMTLQNLSDQMTALRQEKTQTDCFAIPEIAAEAWSLINSREVDEGFYVLFDVGDGTLDGSSFHYWNDRGEKKVDFFSSKVDPLGVTAFSQQLAKELKLLESDIRDTIFGNSARYAEQIRSSQTRKEVQKSVAKVVIQGSQRYRDHGFVVARPGFTEPLAILIGGGGGQTEFYQRAITATHTDFQQKNAGVPEYQIRSLPKPKDLETNGIHSREFHRFSVAYGLSIPKGEQPEIRLPSRMEQLKPNRSQRDSNNPPNYEEMRGSW